MGEAVDKLLSFMRDASRFDMSYADIRDAQI